MSQVILTGFAWGLAFAVSFVLLGYPTLASCAFGLLGGWIWSTIATYWTSHDESVGRPSYLDDIEALEAELTNIGTGGRIDLHKAQRRRNVRADRAAVQARYRSEQMRHRGKPKTMGDRMQELKDRLFPPKKKDGEVEQDGGDGGDGGGEPDYDRMIQDLEANAAQIDAQLKQ